MLRWFVVAWVRVLGRETCLACCWCGMFCYPQNQCLAPDGAAALLSVSLHKIKSAPSQHAFSMLSAPHALGKHLPQPPCHEPTATGLQALLMTPPSKLGISPAN